jgi:hypothetical protein
MKTEQSAFAKRLIAALDAAGIEASPVELEKLVPLRGGDSVTAQAISGWLNGRHLPKQKNMRALASIVGVPPHELQYGVSANKGVRDVNAAWPDHVRGHDRLAFEAFLLLSEHQRKLVRELIAALGETSTRRKGS